MQKQNVAVQTPLAPEKRSWERTDLGSCNPLTSQAGVRDRGLGLFAMQKFEQGTRPLLWQTKIKEFSCTVRFKI